jgi:hypothetical protein
MSAAWSPLEAGAEEAELLAGRRAPGGLATGGLPSPVSKLNTVPPSLLSAGSLKYSVARQRRAARSDVQRPRGSCLAAHTPPVSGARRSTAGRVARLPRVAQPGYRQQRARLGDAPDLNRKLPAEQRTPRFAGTTRGAAQPSDVSSSAIAFS